MSGYNDLLNATQTIVQALGLSGISTGNILVKKLPKVEQVDSLPIILICPSVRPEVILGSSFEAQVFVDYRIDVIIIASGNLDFSSNLSTYLLWREEVRKAFQQAPLAVSIPVMPWKIKTEPLVPLDRHLISELWDYMGLTIVFSTNEGI